MKKHNLVLMLFMIGILGASRPAAATPPSAEAMEFIQNGERPPPPVHANPPGPNDIMPDSGRLGLACFAAGSISHSLLCEYGIRALRTFAQQRARFCGTFTDRATELGQGDLETPNDPGIQQCRHVVNRIKELEQRLRSGQMKNEGVVEAVGNIKSRFSAEIRAWQSQRLRARATCRTEDERRRLDAAWEALVQCNVEMNTALESIASVPGRR